MKKLTLSATLLCLLAGFTCRYTYAQTAPNIPNTPYAPTTGPSGGTGAGPQGLGGCNPRPRSETSIESTLDNWYTAVVTLLGTL